MGFTLANTKEPTGIAKTDPFKFYQYNKLSQPWRSSIMPIFRLYIYLVSCPFGRRPAAARFRGLRTLNPPGSCIYLSLLNVVRCQVEFSATGRSLIQESPTDCCVCVCVCALAQLCVIKCNTNTLHLPWVGERGQTKVKKKNMKNLTEYAPKHHLYVNVSLKFVPVFSEALHHETVMEGGRIVVLSRNFGTSWMWVANYILSTALVPGKVILTQWTERREGPRLCQSAVEDRINLYSI
jgi:hypothetical protein